MSVISTSHGPTHEDHIIGYTLGLDAELQIAEPLRDMVAHCPDCVAFAYRRLADLRALAHGDMRAGARLEELLRESLEQMAWRDHTDAYNRLYGGGVETESEKPQRRWVPIAVGIVLATVVALAVWGGATGNGDRYAEAIPTTEIVDSTKEGARAHLVQPPVDARRTQLLRLRMNVPSPAIGQGYHWLALIATGADGERLLLTSELPADSDVALRAGVPWTQDMRHPGKGDATGAVAALRSGEMAIVVPARLLQAGSNRLRVVAATADPGPLAVAALAATERPDLPEEVARLVASTPVVVTLRSSPPRSAQPTEAGADPRPSRPQPTPVPAPPSPAAAPAP